MKTIERMRGSHVCTAILIVALSLAAPLAAQQRADLARLEIAVWPEYDQPSVLVMLRAWVAPGTLFPASIELPIPAAAGIPSAVAYRGADGGLLMAQYGLETEGEMTRALINTPSPEVRLEYYLPLTADAARREYTFVWPGGAAAAAVTFEVQQPAGATDLSIEPLPSQRTIGNDGLSYHLGQLGAVARDEGFSLRVAYTKPDSTLSAAAAQTSPPTQPPAPERAADSGGGDLESQPSGGLSVWWSILPAALLVAGILVWLALAGKKKAG